MSIFRDMDDHFRRAREEAKRFPHGVGPEQLVPDALFTLSPCRSTGDRSYSHEVWKIICINGGHAMIESIERKPGDFFGGPRTVFIAEHEWYPAEHLAEQFAARHGRAQADEAER